jgi:hypothetical protein
MSAFSQNILVRTQAFPKSKSLSRVLERKLLHEGWGVANGCMKRCAGQERLSARGAHVHIHMCSYVTLMTESGSSTLRLTKPTTVQDPKSQISPFCNTNRSTCYSPSVWLLSL